MTAGLPDRAGAALSDRELSDALGLWLRLRDDDGTLREAVARALWDADHDRTPWEDATEDGPDNYRARADAAIDAMRGAR